MKTFDSTLPFEIVFSHTSHDLVKKCYAPALDDAVDIANNPVYYPIEYPHYQYGFSIQVFCDGELLKEYGAGLEGELIDQY